MEDCQPLNQKRRRGRPPSPPLSYAIPGDMCPRCGLRCGRNGLHENYLACIGALRDLVARLQFARRGAHEDSLLRA